MTAKADIARRHPSNSEWKVKNSNGANYTTATVGSSSATIAPGDFDGDDKTDMAVFSAGTWTIRKSSNSQTETVSFGASGDRPVVGDYDGDDISDYAVFRPSTNTWWIKQSANSQTVSSAFGAAGDITAQGDFDGDGKTDVAVFRPSSGDWHVSGSTAGYYTFHWGIASDIPVPADYDADGKTDFAVYRGTTGVWYAAKSSDSNNSYLTQYWEATATSLFRPTTTATARRISRSGGRQTGTWYIVNSGTANSYTYETLGVAGDTAVSSAYLKQIGGYIYSYDFAKVRLSPKNATGGTDLYSRNFAWGTSLFGLPGRAGLDAGFGISYNSLVWTKDPATNTVVFNADNSNLTPGFRFGFPTIEPVYYDATTQKFAYLMVTPSGGRAEFRQTTNSNIFETADSSYAELKINGTSGPNDPADSLTLTVTGTDGTRADYEWTNGAYRCPKITDRNGNYIAINHDANGLLQSVTDTLGRVVNVNYNNEALPISVTQTWKTNNGADSDFTRTYATFSKRRKRSTPTSTGFR
ncbi:MAG: VCBS repeat-containing protein [Acidobacteria bacterium]|nr:VCBS repeat-containing protein [Acidobacteriota bacterium]